MLRITLPTASSARLFILEGRLTGLWAKELLRVARGTNPGQLNVFDLQDVFYVDSAGEDALRLLGGCGARFITDSAYGRDLCSRLKLRRVATPELENSNRNKAEGSRTPRHRKTTVTGRLDALTVADAKQHSSSRGE